MMVASFVTQLNDNIQMHMSALEALPIWSVVAEWLGHRTQHRGSWVRIPAKARHGICEQDTLKSTALGSQNKQNCLRHVPRTSVKKKKFGGL
jgi:hypothetical protein